MSGQDEEPSRMANAEEYATGLLKSLYGHQITVDGALQLLTRFHAGVNIWEKAVFNFTIKILFEEYKYFHAYPYVERQLAAQLIGGIVNEKLLTDQLLGVAIRLLLEALCNQPGNPMFGFGVAATVMFKRRLKEFPKFCHHLENTLQFKEKAPQHLIQWVRAGALSTSPQQMFSAPAPPVSNPGPPRLGKSYHGPPGFGPSQSGATNEGPPGFGQSCSGSPKLHLEKRAAPLFPSSNGPSFLCPTSRVLDESKQEKVFFIFNNLSLENLCLKTQELSELLNIEDNDEGYWLSEYLVRRATIEPNLHNLYASLLERINSNSFENRVVEVTYKNIGIMLEAERSAANRSVFKNLGRFLGLVLLARDKPILNLDLRSLIIKAFHMGQEELQYVLPFVTSSLESAANSKVFKVPCPWTLGLADLLVELHQQPNLKLNLKFEIEVVCKTLGFDIERVSSGKLPEGSCQSNENLMLQTPTGYSDDLDQQEGQAHQDEKVVFPPSTSNNQNCQSLNDFISLWSLGNQPKAQTN